jgi:hypothetical protein
MDTEYITLDTLEDSKAWADRRYTEKHAISEEERETFRLSLFFRPCTLLEWLQHFQGFFPVSALDFYKDLFSRRDLEMSTDLDPSGLYCGLVNEIDLNAKDHWTAIYEQKKKELVAQEVPDSTEKAQKLAYKELAKLGERVSRTHYITQDFDYFADKVLTSKNFCFASPLSYAGRHRNKECARYCYAICIEIDGLKITKDGTQEGISNLVYQVYNGFLPVPSYIVWSGNGVHLYFILDTPISMFRKNAAILNQIHKMMTKLFWNSYITTLYEEQNIQYESIYQGFRCVGTRTKRGLATDTDEVALAFRYGLGESVSLEYLLSFLNEKELRENWKELEKKSKGYNLREMCDVYGEDWVWRHFDKKTGKPLKHPQRKKWYIKRAFYDSFKNKILDQTEEGHRYKSLKMLISAGEKCGLSWEEIERDVQAVGHELMNKKFLKPFLESDILDALYARNDPNLIAYKSDYMTENAGVSPYPHRRRNGRKQNVHLAMARGMKKTLSEYGEDVLGGRPKGTTKQRIVQDWKKAHPDGRKADCVRETGLDKKTVYKWWQEPQENEK